MSKANLMGKQEMIQTILEARKKIIQTIPEGQTATPAHQEAMHKLEIVKTRIEALKIA